MINEPLPYIFEPSHQWLGADGPWSTFMVSVGTPPQEFHILPATNVQETWVPLPQACALYNSSCPYLRGIPDHSKSVGFATNQSTTWVREGIYDLLSEQNLGYSGNGLYGLDTVQLGNSTQRGPRLEHQVVAGIVDKDFWLGIFGLGPKPANFSDLNDPQPSYMRTLVDQKLIPSLSYGYTAGAKYTSRIGTVGSLTLGGYDLSRFTPNDVSFSFASDDSRSLTVGLQSITATNALQGDVTPLTTGILSLIDSTVSHIWLPSSACEIFERAFGLVYDDATDLYLINSTTHTKLLTLNPIVTFKLGNHVTSGPTVSISLPYGAFDLHLPYYTSNLTNSTNYFPLRRAANDTQYTLGRTFLQEAYIIADYERQNFSVAQAILTSPIPPRHIVPILAPDAFTLPSSETPSSTSGHKLSTGVIIAISILSAIFLVITSLVAFGLYRRYRRSRHVDEPDRGHGAKNWLRASRRSNTRRWVHELDAVSLSEKKRPAVYSMGEHPSWKDRKASRDGKPWTWTRRQELPGSVAAQELEGELRGVGSPVSPSEKKAPWDKGLLELPGHEAKSKRSSARSGQTRLNFGRLIG